MTNDHVSVWNECLDLIKKQVTPQGFTTWFEPIKAVNLKEQIITIQVPNQYSYEMLEEQYINVLRKAIKTVIGPKAKLEYEIPMDNSSGQDEKNSFDRTGD